MTLENKKYEWVAPENALGGRTAIFFKKQASATPQEVAELCYYIKSGNKWRRKTLKAQEGDLFPIGTSPAVPGIKLEKEDGLLSEQAIVRYMDKKWFIMEKGVNGIMEVNGHKKQQVILHNHDSAIVQFFSSTIIFTLNNKDSNQVTGHEFSLVTPAATLNYSMDNPVLIGSDSSCNIHIQGDPFMGIIYAINNALFIHSIADEKKDIRLNGIPVRKLTPLKQDDKIKIATFSMVVSLPPTAVSHNGFSLLPDSKPMRLLLKRIDSDGSLHDQFILPQVGDSLFVGRSPDNGIFIDSESVSRKHAQIIVYDTSILLLDCYSTNGTYLERARIGKKMVYVGSIIAFGTCNYFLTYV